MSYCEHHAWTEMTAIGDAQRTFLCGVCGARRTEKLPIALHTPEAESVWKEIVQETLQEQAIKKLLHGLDLDKRL